MNSALGGADSALAQVRRSKSARNKRRAWWNSLTPEEQEALRNKSIARKRNQPRQNSTWTNAGGTYRKEWLSPDSYSVTRIPPQG